MRYTIIAISVLLVASACLAKVPLEQAQRELEQKAAERASTTRPVETATTQPTTEPANQALGTRPTRGKARKVAYILDVGSPGWLYVPKMKAELQKAVGNLQPDRTFAVLVAKGKEVSAFHSGLVSASDEMKGRAAAFLAEHSDPTGDGDVAPAVRQALTLGPDVIVLVSTGRFGSYPNTAMKSLDAVRRLSKAHQIPINTSILFAPERGAEHALWEVAHDSGGTCVDKDGNPVAEPELPQKAPKPPKPEVPKGPSVFDNPD